MHALPCTRAPPPAPPPPPPLAAPAARRRAAAPRAAKPGGGGGDLDLDVSVFRFTLGIPGFDDALIPRVIGLLGAAALAANHLAAAGPPSDAQARAEALGAALAAVCVAAPSLEARLAELAPGRGRRAAAAAVEGAAPTFALAPSLPEAARAELAWATYALLRNTNTCGVLVARRGAAVAARGMVAAAAVGGGAAATLAACGAPGAAPAAPLYCADRPAMAAAGVGVWAAVPAGARSALVAPLPGAGAGSVLALWSERERALGAKERAWAEAVADKLGAALGGE